MVPICDTGIPVSETGGSSPAQLSSKIRDKKKQTVWESERDTERSMTNIRALALFGDLCEVGHSPPGEV